MGKITEKMARFAEEYVKNGYNGSLAYRTAYNQDDSKVSASEAYKLLRDQRIIDEINRVEGDFRILGQMSGVDKTAIVKAIAGMLEAEKDKGKPDWGARRDAITLYAKLTGDFKEKKELEITSKEKLEDVDLTNLSEEEKAQLEKDLLAEL